MRRTLIAVTMIAVASAASCRRAPELTPEVVAVMAASVPADPGDPAWQNAPEHVEKLLLQDLVEPRLMTPSTPEVRVRAIAS
ncbi:MAG: hypothetical protein OEW19_12230, partial [Acidobacteriota bacterium]|nr:hypothetical protein [Acidobacteriota bacterium]